MKRDPFAVRKQTGKQTAVVAAGPVINASKSSTVKYADTIYYQIAKHGDYVQEQGG